MSLISGRSLDKASVRTSLTTEPEDRGEGALIDLESTRFVDAFGLVAIVTEIETALQRDAGVVVIHSESVSVQHYLSRMGLREYMESVGFEGDALPAVAHYDHSDQLIELTPCTGVGDYEALGDLVFQKITGPGFYPELTRTVYESILELGQNVVDHSGSGKGWVAAQTYRQGRPGEYLVFAVGDSGRGLRRGLAAHRPASDEEAIRLAVTEGVSGTGDKARGFGLPSIVTQSIELGGTTTICSGSATSHHTGRGQSGGANAYLEGTLVGCRIACQPGT